MTGTFAARAIAGPARLRTQLDEVRARHAAELEQPHRTDPTTSQAEHPQKN